MAHLVYSNQRAFLRFSNFQLVTLLRQNHDEMVAMCREHFRIQYELQQCHVTSLYRLLEQIAESRHKEQLARLDKMHDREVVELKRHLDSQNWDEMKQLAQKYSDKNELTRYVCVSHVTSSKSVSRGNDG